MTGDYIEKLHRLYDVEDQVLYRWRVGRAAGARYCVLSSVRFESLACRKGNITFSSAAGYLHYQYGRPMLIFADHDMVVAMSGTRAGINIPARFRRDDEEVCKVANCGYYSVGPNSPAWLVNKVLTMGYDPYYSTFKVVQPEWYRSTKIPENLKPLFNADLLKAIGADKQAPLEELERLFRKNLDRFGVYEEDGYVIPFGLVVSGGRVICATKGIAGCRGGALHCMDGAQFRAETARLHWKLKTGEDDGNTAADLAKLAAGE